MIRRLCIIGIGLIGGSVALAARANGLCGEIVGVDVNEGNCRLALSLGVVDRAFARIEEGAADADWVLIATPVGDFDRVFAALQPIWLPSAIYSDTGSTKQNIVEAAIRCCGSMPPNLVPGHPIAGSERSGAGAAQADLYAGKRVILTPTAETDPEAVRRVRSFWESLGAHVASMDPRHHDEVLGATSHLPHVLAFALVHMLGRKDEQEEIFQYAAGGFRDFTRIASSDPQMWLDICLANREQIVPLIQQLVAELGTVSDMLSHQQPSQLFEFLTVARNARQRFLDLSEK